MGQASRFYCVGTGMWVLLCAPTLSEAGDIPFQHVVIDTNFYGDCKAIGDLTGDGQHDLVVAGKKLVLYSHPTWDKTNIAEAKQEFTTDMQLADVDGDKDLDIVVPDGELGEICWFENPRPTGDASGDFWQRHVIGEGGSYVHDVEYGDFNKDKKPDLVTRVKDGPTVVWLQSNSAWIKIAIDTAKKGEGTAVADINADGCPDIVQNGYWLECPHYPTDEIWEKHLIAPEWPSLARIAVADINNDRRLDVLFAPSESKGRLSWFEAPDNLYGGTWEEHIIDQRVAFVHGIVAIDVDGNGTQDVAFAEMAQSDTKRVGFYLNREAGTKWQLQILATTGSHNIRIGAKDDPATLSIVGSNWQGPPVEMWKIRK